MLCIYNNHTEPGFNLASEEYLLKNFEDDIFMLWRNRASIIVGKHQNTLAEINVDFVKQNNIPVIRRLSGGGTVFHDLGNVNFTFIKKGEEGKLVDFKKYTEPILEVLKTLGIEAKFEGRNDLTIEGKKFSGNAEHVWQNKVLHHGTLLFSANINNLTEALKVNPLKYTDKAVKSIRSRVTNISEHLAEAMEIEAFISLVMNHILDVHQGAKPYSFTEKDIQSIDALVKNKFSQWEWNYGHSPKYNFHREVHTKGGNLEINMDVDQGIIQFVKIYGDFFNRMDISDIEDVLILCPHREETIRERLSQFDLDAYFAHVSLDEFVGGMF